MRIIAGTARSRTIEAPEGRDTRPTLDRVRENLFNILQQHVRGTNVLDLFAGSGALSLEAVSRGAASAVMVDHDRKAVAVEKKNIETLHFGQQIRVLQMEWQQAVQMLSGEGKRFDLVFLDPPYAMHDLTGVTEALKPLLTDNAIIVTEHEADQPYIVADGLIQTDRRHYGRVGLTLYRLVGQEEP